MENLNEVTCRKCKEVLILKVIREMVCAACGAHPSVCDVSTSFRPRKVIVCSVCKHEVRMRDCEICGERVPHFAMNQHQRTKLCYYRKHKLIFFADDERRLDYITSEEETEWDDQPLRMRSCVVCGDIKSFMNPHRKCTALRRQTRDLPIEPMYDDGEDVIKN